MAAFVTDKTAQRHVEPDGQRNWHCWLCVDVRSCRLARTGAAVPDSTAVPGQQPPVGRVEPQPLAVVAGGRCKVCELHRRVSLLPSLLPCPHHLALRMRQHGRVAVGVLVRVAGVPRYLIGLPVPYGPVHAPEQVVRMRVKRRPIPVVAIVVGLRSSSVVSSQRFAGNSWRGELGRSSWADPIADEVSFLLPKSLYLLLLQLGRCLLLLPQDLSDDLRDRRPVGQGLGTAVPSLQRTTTVSQPAALVDTLQVNGSCEAVSSTWSRRSVGSSVNPSP